MIPALFFVFGAAFAGLATGTAGQWRASSNGARSWWVGATATALVVFLELLGMMIRGPR